MLAQVMVAIEPGDPLFVVTAMLTRLLFISLGETEKALLQFGPALSARMAGLEAATETISSDLAAILNATKQLERTIAMLDARTIDRERSLRKRLEQRTQAIVSAEYRAILPWVFGICLAFIAGVVSVSIWTP